MKRQHASKQKSGTHEVRVCAQPIGQRFAVRSNADGTRTVEGYFATFGTISHDLGFREVLQAGCFRDSLRNEPVSCYRDHNSQMLLGKTQSSTLEISEDIKGLAFRVKLPDTTYANDLVSLMERGDAFECSFGFAVKDPNGEVWSQLPNGEILRTITKAVLYEGSILTGPPAAYPNTSANLRSCPADIRAKLKHRSAVDELDPCNDESEFFDPDADCNDDDDDKRSDSDCDCDCPECEDGECDECSNTDCDSDDCISCPAQTRAANMNLLLRRLR